MATAFVRAFDSWLFLSKSFKILIFFEQWLGLFDFGAVAHFAVTDFLHVVELTQFASPFLRFG